MDVKIVGFEPGSHEYALQQAYMFHREFPDREGIRNGVGYTRQFPEMISYVYRTKTLIVVRNSKVN